eukprot:215670_1
MTDIVCAKHILKKSKYGILMLGMFGLVSLSYLWVLLSFRGLDSITFLGLDPSPSIGMIDIPQINYSIGSFWSSTENVEKFKIISDNNHIQNTYKQNIQSKCANGISKLTCNITDFRSKCDMPKFANNAANCNLNDLEELIRNNYNNNKIPKIYHLSLQFNGNDKELSFFDIMYYLSLKSYFINDEPDAVILHFIILNKQNETNYNFTSYKNQYLLNSLKYITHFCEWEYI